MPRYDEDGREFMPTAEEFGPPPKTKVVTDPDGWTTTIPVDHEPLPDTHPKSDKTAREETLAMIDLQIENLKKHLDDPKAGTKKDLKEGGFMRYISKEEAQTMIELL